MNARVLDPRAATAAAIARAVTPYATLQDPCPAAPEPAAVRTLARDRFGLDLTDSEIRAAIKAATR